DAFLKELKQNPLNEIDCISPSEKARKIETERIKDVEVLFCTTPPTNFSEMKSVKWVQIASVGYTQLFDHDLPARSIQASNAQGCFDVPIAEWSCAMLVNLTRDLRQLIKNQEASVWDRGAIFQREIRGKTLG